MNLKRQSVTVSATGELKGCYMLGRDNTSHMGSMGHVHRVTLHICQYCFHSCLLLRFCLCTLVVLVSKTKPPLSRRAGYNNKRDSGWLFLDPDSADPEPRGCGSRSVGDDPGAVLCIFRHRDKHMCFCGMILEAQWRCIQINTWSVYLAAITVINIVTLITHR